MKNIIIFGGTFDPPHNGHINTALAVKKSFEVDHFFFLPCKMPVLKQKTFTSTKQRMIMLKLALENHPEFEVDSREILRPTPSYMVETLESFRKELGENAGIILCLGMDAFMQLPKWHAWQKILNLSNLLIMHRAQLNGQTMPQELNTLLLNHEILDKNNFLTHPYGRIFRFDAGNYPISSTELRNKIQAGHNIEAYLPASVYHYIRAQNLYG